VRPGGSRAVRGAARRARSTAASAPGGARRALQAARLGPWRRQQMQPRPEASGALAGLPAAPRPAPGPRPSPPAICYRAPRRPAALAWNPGSGACAAAAAAAAAARRGQPRRRRRRRAKCPPDPLHPPPPGSMSPCPLHPPAPTSRPAFGHIAPTARPRRDGSAHRGAQHAGAGSASGAGRAVPRGQRARRGAPGSGPHQRLPPPLARRAQFGPPKSCQSTLFSASAPPCPPLDLGARQTWRARRRARGRSLCRSPR
jgi:hypothetical protein